ncbi:MAG: ROK family protein [Chloroflexota bacterium]
MTTEAGTATATGTPTTPRATTTVPAITQTRPVLVGVDVGGTKIAVLITTPDGAILGRATRASSAGDQDGAAEAIATTIETALADAGQRVEDVAVIGVGVPGRVDPVTGNVTIAVNLGWTDLALRDALEARLGRPCVIENDARAAAVGLHHRRVLGEAEDIAYLAVGTGIAAGVILDGRLHRGARGLAGEIGHAIADRAGPVCTCGQRGCLEALVSGPSIARRAAAALARDGGGSRLGAIPLDELTAVDVYEAAAAGDALAADLVEDVGRQLAWAIHLLVMAYDVDRVVVGGGVSHAGETFMAPIQRELDRLRAASPIAGELLPLGVVEALPVGADAGVLGAVAIAQQVLQRDGRTDVAGRRDGTAGRAIPSHAPTREEVRHA